MDIRCPYCNFNNMEGEDRCSQCLHSLMPHDIPKPKKADTFQTVMLTAPISYLLPEEKDMLVASPADAISKILSILQQEGKNAVLVYKKKQLVGIISHRDLLKRLEGKYKNLSKVKAEHVMTPNPEYVTADAPIAYVINKMAMGGYRHVPVLDSQGKPYGVAQIKDVLTYLSKRNKSKPVD